jgi:glycosyltransferase involved in cell wall biosynthesis
MRARYQIKEDTCVFLFGGNMGRAQYIELFCEALNVLKDDKDIYFLFVGRGIDRNKLKETIKKYAIPNARVIDNLPRWEYEQLMMECDVGLVVLNPNFTIPNYPSRILSYMEFAKPVIAATDYASDIKDLIEEAQCGKWVWSGDLEEFILCIREFSKSRNELMTLGRNGRNYALNHFSVSVSVSILNNKLNAEVKNENENENENKKKKKLNIKNKKII